MSAALHKQTYTGLKPSGSFIKIKTATIRGLSGFRSDSAGFPHHASIRRDTPGGMTMEPFDSNVYFYSRETIIRGSNSLEESLHITTLVLFFFLIKNINISGVQKYHR